MVGRTTISALQCIPNGGQTFNEKVGWKWGEKNERHILGLFGNFDIIIPPW